MGRVPRVAAKGFGLEAAQFEKLGDAVAQLHASPTGGTVRQVPDGFAFTPLANNVAPPPAKPVVEPGVQSLLDDRADWCRGCDTTRYRADMRWTVDGAFLCRGCLGPGVGTPALWVSPWEDDDAVVTERAREAADWRQIGYIALTALLSLVFLASALGAFG
ncbi:hypothetical protein SEA_VINCENZO_77 [Mycobacterium phage Vincenzo]|uniref:Uncharacterized protein n=2 Tax=Coopervirus vincenzo TaxID=1983110 RepID=A0A0F6YRR0_9CAUD|nr:hypothetical protein SEA_VINCENZO_77 [Mycobacterium phage Vincenzo]AKF14339.1 hypothetical protein SEA_VINCENZO_77 [Mycobacterium phage Vincenzo]AKF14743.1 hypothetical protein SEA_ALANGRANT_78 [Mycobacterium phage AlanGrant]